MNPPKKITIIGAGLTGLCIAYHLKDTDLDIQILEAQASVGGRISTIYGSDHPPLEMGATWLGTQHTALRQLLQTLEIDTFEQVLGGKAIYEAISTSPPQLVQLPPNDAPSYRVAGGTTAILSKLLEHIDPNIIHYNSAVKSISKETDQLKITTETTTYDSDIVISTLPPYLFHKTIDTQPSLPTELQDVMETTHTWMSESIKVSLVFDTPFWRKADSSGTIFSNVGPVPEMYDHSDVADKKYSLTGFLNGAYFSLDKAKRKELILTQLQKYYGEAVLQYTSYHEIVWRQNSYVHHPYSQHILPHQNNGHQVYRQAYLEGQLYIAGTETARQFPGYIEGAVRSAAGVSDEIKKKLPYVL